MARILKGKEVAAAIESMTSAAVEELKSRGIVPTLAILRVGERADDLAYEHGAVKTATRCGVAVRQVSLPLDVTSDTFFRELEALNNDDSVHGILMFRPLPEHIDDFAARHTLKPEKDVDGCTDLSLAGVFTNTPLGFCPCTAEAVPEILDYYDIAVSGKRVAVVGRSLVVGRPLAMLMLHRNASVTLCHSKTADLASITREAEIVIASTGKPESLGAEFFSPGQIVIDVGIGRSAKDDSLCGDVKFSEVEGIVSAITPVPGGVGSVTAAVLISHTVESAQRKNA